MIRKEHLDVQVRGAECDALALQAQMTRLSGQLTPVIERILDRCVPPERHVYIDRIDVNIGTITIESLETAFTVEVGRAFESSLKEHMQSLQPGPPFMSGNSERTASPNAATTDVLIYFLKTGTLPWSFRLPAGKALEEVIQVSWQEALKSGVDPISNKEALLQALNDAGARKRLVRQSSLVFLETLLSLISAEGKETVETISRILHRGGRSVEGEASFVRELWEAAFARVAKGQQVSASGLVTEAWAALPASAQSGGLADILERNWPQSTVARPPTARKVISRQPASGPLGPEEASSVASPPDSAGPAPAMHRRSNSDENVDALGVGPVVARSSGADANRRDREALDVAHRRPADRGGPGATPSAKSEPAETRVVGVARSADGSLLRRGGTAGHGSEQSRSLGRSSNTSASGRTPLPETGPRPGWITDYEHPEARDGIYVDDAGLVLLHPFLPRFFTALGVSAGDKLVQPERALCLLHFLATGENKTPEYELVLAKLLCNVPLLEPVATGLDLTSSEKAEAVALLEAVIAHWQVLRNTSPDGLRSTFLLRAGKLSLREDGDWLLQVESKSFDILMDQLPWGISVIKLPWMGKMLWVEWH